MEQTIIISGAVSANREWQGEGFSVAQKSKTGIYQISFKTDFDDPPAITATVKVKSGFPDAVGIDVIIPTDSQTTNCEQVEFQIRDTYSKDLEDHDFSFIAIGLVTKNQNG